MGAECSECERDLRGGHDESCSRYSYRACPDCGVRLKNRDPDDGWDYVCVCCGREFGWFNRDAMKIVRPNID